MHHLFPADELAEVRSEIARLKLREAQLRDKLLKSPLSALTGRFHRVEIAHLNTSVFDPALLPEDIRSDPAYWRDRAQTVVRTCPIAPKVALPRPGWPIRRATGFTPVPAH